MLWDGVAAFGAMGSETPDGHGNTFAGSCKNRWCGQGKKVGGIKGNLWPCQPEVWHFQHGFFLLPECFWFFF